jgi:hypothetical protein
VTHSALLCLFKYLLSGNQFLEEGTTVP